MTTSEKVKCSTDKTKFTLYKEGLLYKCYNEDAMVFTQRVRVYKVNVKFVKSVGEDVLKLGFAVEIVTSLMTKLSWTHFLQLLPLKQWGRNYFMLRK